MSNFGEVHSRFSAVMKRINSTAAKLFFLKLAVGRTIGLFYGRLTHIRSPSQEMKWENEWLMFALLGISTFLFQKKERKGENEKIVLVAIHQSPSDVRLMEKLCRAPRGHMLMAFSFLCLKMHTLYSVHPFPLLFIGKMRWL